MRVLVTGANGFIGSALCAGLLEMGYAVRALVRQPTAPPGAEHVLVRDLGAAQSFELALKDVDAVVHLAARVHVMHDDASNPLTEFRRVNVQGTRTLLDAASLNGVRRFLFLSSVKAVGESSTEPWHEGVRPAPIDPYGISKREAEELVLAADSRRAIEGVVLRLPLVYGPGMRANMLRLFESVSRGLPLPLGGVRNSRSIAYVGNVVAAIERLLVAPGAGGRALFVADEPPLSTPALILAIAAALGVRPRLLTVPPTIFKAAGRVGDVLSYAFPSPLTSAAVSRLLGSLAVDTSALTSLVGPLPFSTTDGLRATAAWFRAREELA
jgi:nucleoside-diphosphate-sugar epimerase